MGRASRWRKRRQQGGGVSGPLGPGADLPPDVARMLALCNEDDDGFTAESSRGGTVWTIRDPQGNTAMEFESGPAAEEPIQPERLGLGSACMNVGGLWSDPEFRRQLEADLVDIWGKPTHPEGRDFFTEHHGGHDHGRAADETAGGPG